MKRLTMVNGEVRDADDHPQHHNIEYRRGRGVYCHDCEAWIASYNP